MNHIEQEWTARRLSVPIPGTFANAVAKFEETIGVYPIEDFAARVQRVETWEEILDHTHELAPLGFLIYWRNDVDKMMSLAGDNAVCVSYLMGNHTIAERMFRHDARVMNYAPLRVELTQEVGGDVLFTVDQPSTQFGSFGNAEILEVGIDLDHKLAVVIERIGGTAPAILRPVAAGGSSYTGVDA
jgi:hypothetical protein